MTERTVLANDVELCTESFGDPADPAILLIQGIGASMLWWDTGFCQLLARGRRLVIRYDHRDTGRSISYGPGHAKYTGTDLVADAAGVLDAHGVLAAHVVGVSAGGAFAQLLALDHPGRVLSLVLISTSPAVPVDHDLPSPTERFGQFVTTAEADWSDPDSLVEYLVEYVRMTAGGERPFDDAAVRDLVRRDMLRARDFASVRNHDSIPDGDRQHPPLSSISVPTLVVHGTADPMFPLRHGEVLAQEIPGARLLALPGAGHGVDQADAETIGRAILEHTTRAGPR